jgi:hypothetical protein
MQATLVSLKLVFTFVTAAKPASNRRIESVLPAGRPLTTGHVDGRSTAICLSFNSQSFTYSCPNVACDQRSRVVSDMGISLGRVRLTMAQEASDERQGGPSAYGDAGRGMA